MEVFIRITSQKGWFPCKMISAIDMQSWEGFKKVFKFCYRYSYSVCSMGFSPINGDSVIRWFADSLICWSAECTTKSQKEAKFLILMALKKLRGTINSTTKSHNREAKLRRLGALKKLRVTSRNSTILQSIPLAHCYLHYLALPCSPKYGSVSLAHALLHVRRKRKFSKKKFSSPKKTIHEQHSPPTVSYNIHRYANHQGWCYCILNSQSINFGIMTAWMVWNIMAWHPLKYS
jgi:hypothetical protein